MSERLLTDAIVAALEAEGLLVGDGEKPPGGGWQGTPGASSFLAYCVLHPISGGWTTGSLADPHAMPQVPYQVSCYGSGRAQAQSVVDEVHPVMLGLRPDMPGFVVTYVDSDMLGGARRDDMAQPPIWQAVPRYRFYLSSRTFPDS